MQSVPQPPCCSRVNCLCVCVCVYTRISMDTYIYNFNRLCQFILLCNAQEYLLLLPTPNSLASKLLDFCQVFISASSHLFNSPVNLWNCGTIPIVQNCAMSSHDWCGRPGFQGFMLCCFPNDKFYLYIVSLIRWFL